MSVDPLVDAAGSPTNGFHATRWRLEVKRDLSIHQLQHSMLGGYSSASEPHTCN